MQQVPHLRQPGAQEGAVHLVQVLVEYQEQPGTSQGAQGQLVGDVGHPVCHLGSLSLVCHYHVAPL